MKKIRIFIKCIAWSCLVAGVGVLLYKGIFRHNASIMLPILGTLEGESLGFLGAGMTFVGVVVALIAEDDSSWGSVQRLFERKK